MNIYAIIKDGIVENTIEYESQPTTPPPGFGEGYVAVPEDRVSPGWRYEQGVFIDTTPPVAPMMVVPAPTLVEQILASPKDLAALKQALGL